MILCSSWLDRAGKAGEHLGFADLLIATIAVEWKAPVWSLDSAFARMGRPCLVSIHRF